MFYSHCVPYISGRFANSKKIRKQANKLRRYTTSLAEQYLIKTTENIAKLEKEQMRLDKELLYINDLAKRNYYATANITFDKELLMITQDMGHAQNLIDSIRVFMGDLESMVYGTMCFDVVGATSKIDTKEERVAFQELTEDAVEVALAELGLDADLVTMRIIKQKYTIVAPSSTSNRNDNTDSNDISSNVIAKTKYNPSPSNSNDSTANRLLLRRKNRYLLDEASSVSSSREGLALEYRQLTTKREQNPKNKFVLRVGTLVGVICRCLEDVPITDVWARRRRRRRLAVGEHKNVQEEEEQQQQSGELAVYENIFFQQQQQQQEEEERQLTNSKFQRRYIQALNNAFQQGPLAGVVDVEQVACQGFLSEKEALNYIQGFNRV